MSAAGNEHDMTVRYVAGQGRGIVRGGVLVVLPGTPEPALVGRLWEALDPADGAEPGVLDALTVLTADAGAALTKVPPFAIAAVRGSQVHAMVRGACAVVVETADGLAVTVDGAGISTWSERLVPDALGLAVRVDDARELLPMQGTWPLTAGVVATTAVGVRLTLPGGPRPAAPFVPAQAQAPMPVSTFVPPPPAARPAPVETPAPAPDVLVSLVPAPPGPVVAPAVGAPPLPPAPMQGDAITDPARDAGATGHAIPNPWRDVPERDVPESAAGDASASSPSETAAPETDAADVAAADAAPAAPEAASDADAPETDTPATDPSEPEGETYGHLWGSTVMRGVEAAAVREDEEEGEEETPPPAGLIAGVPTWAPAAPAAPPASATPPASAARATSVTPPAQPASAGTPAGTPVGTPTVAPTTPTPLWPDAPVPEQTMPPELTDASYLAAAAEDLDHDGSTVLSSAIADLRAAADAVRLDAAADTPVVAPRPRGPQILGRTCPQGHVNPPNRDTCRACGEPLVGDAAIGERPLLGRLRVSTGEVVDLDRPVVVGRRPRGPRSADGAEARLVTVPSPSQDISRSHVEVRLDGWHVLVADLATTNGTVLRREGQPPLRLHPHEGVLVVDGDVVDLGDGITCTFEEVW